MPRPTKYRCVSYKPEVSFFKPAAVPMGVLEVVIMSFDEIEAIRLADYEGLYQEEAAKRMNISRQTFGNIVSSARKKIADAIINGKAIKIEGGAVNFVENSFFCKRCGHKWNNSDSESTYDKNKCPNCNK